MVIALRAYSSDVALCLTSNTFPAHPLPTHASFQSRQYDFPLTLLGFFVLEFFSRFVLDFERFLDLEAESEMEDSSPVAEDMLPRSISAVAAAAAAKEVVTGADCTNARERREDLSGSAD